MSYSNEELTKRLLALEAAELALHQICRARIERMLSKEDTERSIRQLLNLEIPRLEALQPQPPTPANRTAPEPVQYSQDEADRLKRLVVYAHEVYGLGAATAPHWQPFDHVGGQLSQLDNLLTGIHGLFQTYKVRISIAKQDAEKAKAERNRLSNEHHEIHKLKQEAEDALRSADFHSKQYARLCSERDEAYAQRDAAKSVAASACHGRDERVALIKRLTDELTRMCKEAEEKAQEHEQLVEHDKNLSRLWQEAADARDHANRLRSAAELALNVAGFQPHEGGWLPPTSAAAPQPPPKPAPAPIPTCIECHQPATWVRRTQFAGDHFYCVVHAKAQNDFGEDDHTESMFWQRVADMKPDRHDGVPA